MLCVTIVHCVDGWVGVLTFALGWVGVLTFALGWVGVLKFALGQDYVCDLLDYFWTDKTDLA